MPKRKKPDRKKKARRGPRRNPPTPPPYWTPLAADDGDSDLHGAISQSLTDAARNAEPGAPQARAMLEAVMHHPWHFVLCGALETHIAPADVTATDVDTVVGRRAVRVTFPANLDHQARTGFTTASGHIGPAGIRFRDLAQMCGFDVAQIVMITPGELLVHLDQGPAPQA